MHQLILACAVVAYAIPNAAMIGLKHWPEYKNLISRYKEIEQLRKIIYNDIGKHRQAQLNMAKIKMWCTQLKHDMADLKINFNSTSSLALKYLTELNDAHDTLRREVSTIKPKQLWLINLCNLNQDEALKASSVSGRASQPNKRKDPILTLLARRGIYATSNDDYIKDIIINAKSVVSLHFRRLYIYNLNISKQLLWVNKRIKNYSAEGYLQTPKHEYNSTLKAISRFKTKHDLYKIEYLSFCEKVYLVYNDRSDAGFGLINRSRRSINRAREKVELFAIAIQCALDLHATFESTTLACLIHFKKALKDLQLILRRTRGNLEAYVNNLSYKTLAILLNTISDLDVFNSIKKEFEGSVKQNVSKFNKVRLTTQKAVYEIPNAHYRVKH